MQKSLLSILGFLCFSSALSHADFDVQAVENVKKDIIAIYENTEADSKAKLPVLSSLVMEFENLHGRDINAIYHQPYSVIQQRLEKYFASDKGKSDPLSLLYPKLKAKADSPAEMEVIVRLATNTREYQMARLRTEVAVMKQLTAFAKEYNHLNKKNGTPPKLTDITSEETQYKAFWKGDNSNWVIAPVGEKAIAYADSHVQASCPDSLAPMVIFITTKGDVFQLPHRHFDMLMSGDIANVKPIVESKMNHALMRVHADTLYLKDGQPLPQLQALVEGCLFVDNALVDGHTTPTDAELANPETMKLYLDSFSKIKTALEKKSTSQPEDKQLSLLTRTFQQDDLTDIHRAAMVYHLVSINGALAPINPALYQEIEQQLNQ